MHAPLAMRAASLNFASLRRLALLDLQSMRRIAPIYHACAARRSTATWIFAAPPRVSGATAAIGDRLLMPCDAFGKPEKPDRSLLRLGPPLLYEGYKLYQQVYDSAMMHSFAARAARAATSKVTARQASNVAVPSSAETQGFARDGVSRCTPSARRRPGPARRRRGRRLQFARRN